MTPPEQPGPQWGPTAGQPRPRVPWSRRKRITVWSLSGIVGFFVLMFIIGTIAGPPKKDTSTTAAEASPANASPSSSPTPTTSRPTPSASPAPTTPARATPSTTSAPPAKPKPKPKPKTLAHGPQFGLTNCIITYKDAQKGPDTSTFTALVLDDAGKPYSPTGPYGVLFQLSLVGDDGTSFPVSEALGQGSRTAADNGGSDWFTTNQGFVQVNANSSEGMVISTLPIPLAEVKSVGGSIIVSSQNDANYLKQAQCAVRPA